MRPLSVLPAVAFSAASALAFAQGDGTFEERPLRLPVFSGLSIAAGDFNRDGTLDLALGSGREEIDLLIQSPGSRTRWELRRVPSGFSGSSFVRAVDLDADGDDDLAVASPGEAVSVLLSRGDGTFEGAVRLREAVGPRWIAAGDFDGDGKVDLATANHTLETLSVFLGRGGGAFRHRGDHAVPGAPRSVEALDLEGDGRTDLVVGLSLRGVLLLRGKGDGSFETGSLDPTFGDGECIAAADLDGDGFRDLISSCSLSEGSVGINLGNGTFVKTHGFPETGAVAVGDLDGDGKLDLAAVNVRRELLVHPGKGDGSFLDPVSFGPVGALPDSLLALDLDGDGREDLVSTGPLLTVLWGQAGEPFLVAATEVSGFYSPGKDLAIADLDQDGAPDLFIPRGSGTGVDVYLRPGRGSAAAPSFQIATEGRYSSLEAVDLDRDAIPDLVGVDPERRVALAALLDRRGSVRSEVALPTGSMPQAVAAGRVDGDPLLDLAVAGSGPNQVSVFLGREGGAFGEARTAPASEIPRDLALGDLDRDGLADLAVIGHSDRVGAPFFHTTLEVFFGAGGGDLSPSLTLVDTTETGYFREVAIGEVNGDGILDLVTLATDGFRVFHGRPGRGFEAPRVLEARPDAFAFALSDLDGNGLLDIATADYSQMSVSVLLNRAPGGFAEAVHYRIELNPEGIRIADLDQDGALDLIAHDAQSAATLFGRPAGAPAARFRRGDADGDRRVEINDPIAVLGWLFLGAAPLPCPDAADAGDDGQVDVSDAIAVLGWLFLGGAPLAPPAACGEDPTGDALPRCAPSC